MPKEAKKRGRRAEKARKEAKAQQSPPPIAEPEHHYHDDGGGGEWEEEGGIEFYGLLTEQEQEYFRRADDLLEGNAFADSEERELFVANVWKEAQGKELKIASSQGCSRVLEKLIFMAGVRRLKAVWRGFMGHFLNLVQHRFASHCCEMLFERSAVWVTRELDGNVEYGDEMAPNEEEAYASMESLFLYMINELEPHFKHLCTDRFASHTIRGLLLLLSGQKISSSDLVQSRKKEKITVSIDLQQKGEEEGRNLLPVPQSFHDAVGKILAATAGGLSTEEIRSMAVHQIGSPMLQVLMQLEMGRSGKERKAKAKRGESTLLGKLTGIGADGEGEGTESSSFFNNLLYDPVGSHLAEKVMVYVPNREFKRLYATFFKTRMGSLARNDTAGFVVQRILEKLERDVLEEALHEILPQVEGLVERSQVAVVRTLIDCCAKMGIEAGEIAEAISSAYDCGPTDLILKMLKITPEELTPQEESPAPARKAKRDPSQRYGSLLAQSMLQLSGKFHQIIAESLLAQTPQTITALSQHPQASHLVQEFLLSSHTTTPHKRIFLNTLRGSFLPLALHPNGSHIVDACWTATHGVMHLKQSIADELLAGEAQMRESFFGKTVWRNWGMDKYKMKRQAWFNMASQAGGLLDGGGDGACDGDYRKPVEKEKTAIELARERHAAKMKGEPGGGGSSSAFPSASKRQRETQSAVVARGSAGHGTKKTRTR